MSLKNELLEKFKERRATIGVVGMGYVGLPLAVEIAEAGCAVIGLDVDVGKVERINAGASYIADISDDRIQALVGCGMLRASSCYDDLRQADAISICVPTPLRKTRDPDMSYIVQATRSISEICGRGMLIVLESTTYPGTTEEVVMPDVVKDGWVVGEDIFIAYSPERIDPGNKHFSVRNTPKVVGGVTRACAEVAAAMYQTAVDEVLTVSSTTTAEMVKLLENTFRAVNIGLVNEMALMCDKLNIDVWEVIHAAATKPFGYMPFYPGPGLGGHCIPVDPHYLSWKLKTMNYNARFIELASEVNTSMPFYVIDKIVDALNDQGRAVRGSKIVILGVAYKPDVDDTRESPALDIISLLRQKGADVGFVDPHVPEIRLDSDVRLCSQPLCPSLLQEADCVVIVTDHSVFDWSMIAENSQVIVDTRHVLKDVAGAATVVSL